MTDTGKWLLALVALVGGLALQWFPILFMVGVWTWVILSFT